MNESSKEINDSFFPKNTESNAEMEPKMVEAAREKAMLVAKEVGDFILEKYLHNVHLELKDDGSHVTAADNIAENLIATELKKEFPDFGFFGEETGKDLKQADFEWVVDPLDGTINFGNGIDIFGISIGLRYKNKPVAGVVYIPSQNILFSGDVFTGAFANSKKIRVDNKQLNKKKPYSDSAWGSSNFLLDDEMKAVKGKPRIEGSSAHKFSYLAAGGYGFALSTNIYLWDLIASISIVRAAGGDILIWDDEKWKKYEEIDQSKFTKSASFATIAASAENLEFMKKHTVYDSTQKPDFGDVAPKYEISKDDATVPEHDSGVVEEFKKMVPDIIKIVRKKLSAREIGTVDYKQDGSEITGADVEIEEELRAILLAKFPDFNFTGEESESVETKSKYGFIIDPIDGTSNYSNGLPIYSTTISLTCDGVPIGGLIYFPVTDMVLFNDEKTTFVNRFNRCNNWSPKPVKVRDDIFDNIDNQIPFGFDSYARQKAIYGKDVKKILNQPRTFGGATSIIAYTAAGNLGGFILSSAALYDYAGGVSLIEKAGGRVFILDTEEQKWKTFNEMFPKLIRDPKKKRFVVGGAEKVVRKIMQNMNPTTN